MNFRALFVALVVVAVAWVDSHTVDPDTENWIRTLFVQPKIMKMRRELRDSPRENLQNFFMAINILKNDRILEFCIQIPEFDKTFLRKVEAYIDRNIVRITSDENSSPNNPDDANYQSSSKTNPKVNVNGFENALNQAIPGVYVPFWNNTLDNSMSEPSMSSLFTSDFLGNGRGLVSTGPFRDWNTPHGLLRRNIDQAGWLMDNLDEQNVMSRFYLEDITFPNAGNSSNVEEMHNNVHVWVGGQMSKIESACYDPMFWMHHAYIDCIWEKFRAKQRANGIDPNLDYPLFSFGEKRHAPNSPLGFGWLLVRHAIHDYFAESFYRCAETPSCSRQRPSCGSVWLECDFKREQCVTRPVDKTIRLKQPLRDYEYDKRRGRFSKIGGRRTFNRILRP